MSGAPHPGRSGRVLSLLACGAAALALCALHAGLSARGGAERMAAARGLVAAYGLTDLALFTDARFSRHPAMADLHSAFQDAPMAFEHFPSGSFSPRPAAGFGRGALGFDAQEVQR